MIISPPLLPPILPYNISLYVSEEGNNWAKLQGYIPFFEAAISYTIAEVFESKGLSFLYDSEKGQGIEVGLLLSHDEAMQKLNAIWRKKDTPTNVLSFPAIQSAMDSLEKKMKEHILLFPQNPLCLGDIVLSYETCTKEAAVQHKPLLYHLLHLVTHGCLHLLGYTHETDLDAQEMETIEIKVLSLFQVPSPYDDRKYVPPIIKE